MTSVFIKRGNLDIETQIQGEYHVNPKTATYKPRREASGELFDTLTLDFQPPGPRENRCLLFKPPSWWYLSWQPELTGRTMRSKSARVNRRQTSEESWDHESHTEEFKLKGIFRWVLLSKFNEQNISKNRPIGRGEK